MLKQQKKSLVAREQREKQRCNGEQRSGGGLTEERGVGGLNAGPGERMSFQCISVEQGARLSASESEI